MRPDFIGIGAQKAGTSWIYACLDDHPDVHVPIKEIHFFSKEKVYARGLDWYFNHFSSKKAGQVTGEFSTTYLHSDAALLRIADAVPDTKIIVSLRDPIERAKSHFGNDIKAGLVTKDADMATMVGERSDYIMRGFYAEKLRWLFDNFGRERVLVLVLEESYADPESFIANIFRFLGVDDTFRPQALHQKINVSEVPRSLALHRLYDRISGLLRTLHLGGVLRYLRHLHVIELLRRLNRLPTADKPTEPKWDPEIIRRLEDDRRELEELLGRKLDGWTSARFMPELEKRIG